MAGRPKNIESPDKLHEYFLTYEKETKNNPFIIKDWVGGMAKEVVREKERPLTMEGFSCWLYDKGYLNSLSNYMANSNNAYDEFSSICSHIKERIRKDQIEGGMSGQFNPSITQRLNNLAENTKTELSGGLNVPTLPDIGNRK